MAALGSGLRGGLRSKGGGFSGAAEAQSARRLPRKGRCHSVSVMVTMVLLKVELDMDGAALNVLASHGVCW